MSIFLSKRYHVKQANKDGTILSLTHWPWPSLNETYIIRGFLFFTKLMSCYQGAEVPKVEISSHLWHQYNCCALYHVYTRCDSRLSHIERRGSHVITHTVRATCACAHITRTSWPTCTHNRRTHARIMGPICTHEGCTHHGTIYTHIVDTHVHTYTACIQHVFESRCSSSRLRYGEVWQFVTLITPVSL